MTTFQVIDAKPYHVGAILHRMRHEHRDAIVSLGLNAHRELRMVFDASSFRRAWLIDGKLAALGGMTGSIAETDACVWLMLSQEAIRYPVETVREARAQLAEMTQTRGSLRTTVLEGDETAERFARLLGFRAAHPAAQPFPGLTVMERRPVPTRPVMRHRDERPFVIYALGRSRTAWLAEFLSYGRWTCRHEVAVQMRSVDDIGKLFRQRRIGTAETAAAPGWQLIRHHVPGVREVVIRRPAEAVFASFVRSEVSDIAAINEEHLRRTLAYEARVLDAIARETGVMVLNHLDLDTEEGCAAIFEHCLPYRFDREWWGCWRDRNVQADARSLFSYFHANREAVERFKKLCKSEMFRLARAGSLRKVA